MNITEAKQLVIAYEQKSIRSKEEDFQYEEALLYLFNKTKEAKYVYFLGSHYYTNKVFDLALKYYSLAANLGFISAYLCLGYVYYYGRTGERDYKQAFECYEKITKAKVGNDLASGEVKNDMKREASLKLADMYKNGYYVSKDYNKYKEIINNLYHELDYLKDHNVYDKYTEVGLRKARIYEEEGEIEKAIDLYFVCKDELSLRISHSMFFGDVNQMSWTINDIYRLIEFDDVDFDLYDLFYLLNDEHKVQFLFENKTYIIESKKENDEMSYRFEDKWYRSFNDLIMKVTLKQFTLPELYAYSRLSYFRLLK